MKVFQIISESPAKAGLIMGKGEYLGYSYDPNSKTLTYPDGRSVKANNVTDAQKLSKAHKGSLGTGSLSKGIPNASNPGVSTKLKKNPLTWTDKADYDIKSNKGKVIVKYRPEGGKLQTFKGSAKEVLQQMGKSGDKGALRGLARIGKNASNYNKYAVKALKSASFLGMGYVGYDAYTNWLAERAAIREVFKNVYQGSVLDSNHPVYNKLISYHTKVAAATIGAAVASEAVQLIAAGKVVKMLKYARALQVGFAATGVGAVIALLIWVLTEGSMWMAKWWFQKYGPEYFQGSAIDMFAKVEGDIVPKPELPDVDNAEVKQEIKNAAKDSDDAITDPTLAFKNWKKATESFVN
jgi:hypothetical protein